MPFRETRSAGCARAVAAAHTVRRGLALTAVAGGFLFHAGALLAAQTATPDVPPASIAPEAPAASAEASVPGPRTVVLIDAGTRREVTTSAATVGEMLAQEKAFPGREDRCSVRLSTPIHQDLVVTVTRVETRRRVERVALPFPVKVRFSTVLRSGTRIVKQAGRRGERVKTFAETYKDGRLVRTKKIAQTGTQPVPQVVVAGTRGLLASRGYFSGRRVLDMVATGYGPNCNGRWGARTASGLRPGYGVVAVDPRFIPLGTRVFVEGYGYAVAGDTGGAIKGNRIDLGFDSHRAAVLTGRKRVKVIILN